MGNQVKLMKSSPRLHDIEGQIYNPRKALRLFDQLAAGDTDLLKDKILMNSIKRALVKEYHLEPVFQKGRNGRKYDRYFCQDCGTDVTDPWSRYCDKCGQRLTDPVAGRRMTQEEQEKYWEE